MSPYVKIAIKIGIVAVVCLILIVAYNQLGHRAYAGAVRGLKGEVEAQRAVAAQLDSLLQYQDLLPGIRYVQLRDMETIRVLVPPSDEFTLTSYLRQIHIMLTENHLETDGIMILTQGGAVGGTSFEEGFTSDVEALQGQLDKITGALQMFRDNKGQMDNMLVSFPFYEGMSTGSENFAAIIGGIESHAFGMSVKGSYMDIKKFTYDVFNMRPHTALVDFQMLPSGPGMGATRLYTASFKLVTYGDANEPPPLWIAYHKRGETAQAGGTEPGVVPPGTPEGTSIPPAEIPPVPSEQPAPQEKPSSESGNGQTPSGNVGAAMSGNSGGGR